MNKLKIAFLGGSVTAGYPFDSIVGEPYPVLIKNELSLLFPEKEIIADNFAVSGTTSAYGLFQAEEHLRDGDYDIVFLEYAVNDEVCRRSIKTYESLMRKIAAFNSHPTVISVIVTTKDNRDAGSYIQRLCHHYGFPCVNIAEALKGDISNGLFCWEDYSFDNVHPNHWGQKYICDHIMDTLKRIMIDNSVVGLKEPFFKAPFENLKTEKLNGDISFPYTVSLKCKSFFIVFTQHLENDFGSISVCVDGKTTKLLHGKNIFSWYYPVPICIFEEELEKEHTIELKLLEKSDNKKFIIEYFGWA